MLNRKSMIFRYFKYIFCSIIILLMTVKIAIAEDATLIKILVIEDERDVREPLVESLQNNYNVRSAENVKQGLSVWESFQPDIVILDMTMPLDVDKDLNRKAGVTLLKQAPKDKAKVILSSSLEANHPSIRNALRMVDYNFSKVSILGKVTITDIDNLTLIMRELLNNMQPPVRNSLPSSSFLQRCFSAFGRVFPF